MNKFRSFCFIVCLIASFLAGAVSRPIVSFAWGDSTPGGKGRQTYTLDDSDLGELDDVITFNSLVAGHNGELLETGSELNFVSALPADADIHDYWQGNNIAVEDGKEYVVRLYVHNNSPKGIAGTSTGTKVAISGIGASKTNAKGKQEVEVNGFIESDNATPKEYWDYVRFYSNTSFHLDYVYGSAMIYNRGATGTTDPISAAEIESKSGEELKALLNSHTVTGKPLGDDIVLKQKADGTLDGQLIGFDALDGNVPGCYEYSSYITIRVKAVYDYEFAAEVKVRKGGGGKDGWKESINAQVGDRVEFCIDYKNMDAKTNDDNKIQNNVTVSDALPSNLKYVPGTAKIYDDSTDGEWIALTSGDNIATHGVDIGCYSGGSNASIAFTAQVVDSDLKYGKNTLVNWGQANVGSTSQAGYAVVIVQKSGYFVITVLSVLLIFCIICSIVLLLKIIKRK